MSEDKDTIHLTQYAIEMNVDAATIREHIANGLIKADPRGYVSRTQANASWGRIRRARMRVQSDDDGRRSANAKIAGAVAKLRIANDLFAVARERYISRAEVVATAGADVEALLTALKAVPQRYASSLAARLDCEEAAARSALDEFIELALAELGDIRAEALRLTEAA
jgi:hypothetical protein